MSYRSAYRRAAKAALQALPALSDMTFLDIWAGSIDTKTLPVIGILTPGERIRPASSGQFECVTTLQIVLKRSGAAAALEDQLDADAALIEPAVRAAIWSAGVQIFPTGLSVTSEGDGSRPLGTLVLDFEITSWRAAQ
ncbi:hypothetical protein [Falsigemmobacter faecalis]|uniref:DUF3168 domain-containing protein n=1 Tax=Falsigemmobacter faecalis TaxID=2488730 RepID=A0A3P3DAM6_9RHOB|nr:hypothetical protein [Falsigemmobacter faecalis]RRH71400.1 hypothetical protein EG244_16425 [Falsigemmobacter faecalis]